MPTIIRFGENVFLTEDFEDFYHTCLYHERLTLDFMLRNFPKGSAFVDIEANIGGYAIRLGRSRAGLSLRAPSEKQAI